MHVDDVLKEILKISDDLSVEEVYLFGSRAKGTESERSDIDIAVMGAIDFELYCEKIDDIDTLYTIDILNLDTCRNDLLLEDIKRYGRKIYEKI